MKKRRNPTKAEREAMASYQAMMLKWANVPKFSRSNIGDVRSKADVRTLPVLTTPPGRTTGKEHKSLDTGFNGGTKPIMGRQYTGTRMIGIAVMHKSNSVPVFSADDAVDLARMRRG